MVVTTPHLLLPRFETVAAVERELDRHRRAFEVLLSATEGDSGLPDLGLGQEILAPSAELIAPVLPARGWGSRERRIS